MDYQRLSNPEHRRIWAAIRKWYVDNNFPNAAYYLGQIVADWVIAKRDPAELLAQLNGPPTAKPAWRRSTRVSPGRLPHGFKKIVIN